MKHIAKMALALLAVGFLVWGSEGVAMAAANKPNLAETGHQGYAPDYNYPMDTTQPSWTHNIEGGGYVGYPPDYSNAPNATGWTHNIEGGGYVGYPPDYSNAPNSSGWSHM